MDTKIKTWQERRRWDKVQLEDAGSRIVLPLHPYMEAEIADLRAALAAAQPSPGLAPAVCVLTDTQIELLWVRHADVAERGKRRLAFGRAVEAAVLAAQPAPAPLNGQQDAKDAARYRWLRQFPTHFATDVWGSYGAGLRTDKVFINTSERLDAAIDAMTATPSSQKGTADE